MKISKLFHWLYAILMLLPVFFIGGRCLYVVFNKNAKDSYSGENIQETTFLPIEDKNDLDVNTLYELRLTPRQNMTTSLGQSTNRINFTDVVVLQNTSSINLENARAVGFYKNNNNSYISYWYDENNTSLGSYTFSTTGTIIIQFTYVSNSLANGNILLYDTLYALRFNAYNSLDNAFIYSVSQLNEVPLFSWAKTSFLVQPFSYITGLFGIAGDNEINTLLSYWLSISIIWLVFDLVMYVPLLVHRWLDKGVLE